MSGAAGAGATGAGMKTATTTVSWIQEREEDAWTYCSRGYKKKNKKNKRLLSRKRRKMWRGGSSSVWLAILLVSYTHHVSLIMKLKEAT